MFHVPRLRSLFLHDQHIFLFYMLAYGKSAGKKNLNKKDLKMLPYQTIGWTTGCRTPNKLMNR